MIYKVYHEKSIQTYEGFAPMRGTFPIVAAFALTSDGHVETWRIDPKNVKLGVEELKRYYRAEYGEDAIVRIYYRETSENGKNKS